MRTIVDLPQDQLAALADLCSRERISRAEAIRRAVNLMLEAESNKRAKRMEALKATFGIWKDRGVSADDYLAELRAEWDR